MRLKPVRFAVAPCLAALLMHGVVTAAASSSVTRSYYAPAGEVYLASQSGVVVPWGAPPCGTDGPGIGGACFLISSTGTVDITIADDLEGAQVAAQYAFRNDAGTTIGPGKATFCGHITLTVPKGGATNLVVTVGVLKPAYIGVGTVPVLPCNAPAPGTSGKITVSGAVIGNAGQTAPASAVTVPRASAKILTRQADPGATLNVSVSARWRLIRLL
ncbi:MAG: hypothetical protein ACYDGR_04975 [Candidatus Dormibacteria bacterium]